MMCRGVSGCRTDEPVTPCASKPVLVDGIRSAIGKNITQNIKKEFHQNVREKSMRQLREIICCLVDPTERTCGEGFVIFVALKPYHKYLGHTYWCRCRDLGASPAK